LPKGDFTLAQANDLARYFFGPDWTAILDPSPDGFSCVLNFSPTGNGGNAKRGRSWREVFRAAGVQLPLRPQYVAKGTSVMFGETAICTAVSNTSAKRIAAALNNHIPDRRGI